LAGRDLDHAKCVTTAHRLDRQPAVMFSNVVVGVKELEAGRDALCLARPLTSANGNLTLAHVQVVAPKPAPDSGAAGAAARHQDALERLTALRDESRLDAEVVCGEARDVQTGLHDITRAGDADLLVLGSHRRGPVGPLGTGIAQRLADAPPCPLLVVRRRAYDDKLIFDTFISLL
jgi:nucleotide-binding universal stress UspA family protein